jgi:hypothetical protein
MRSTSPIARTVLRTRETTYKENQWVFDAQLDKAFSIADTEHADLRHHHQAGESHRLAQRHRHLPGGRSRLHRHRRHQRQRMC